MRKRTFGEFTDKKLREANRQLTLIKQLLESNGLKVENFLDSEKGDAYIFCHNTGKGSFDGVRIYKIGNIIAFRVQKENKTHPYGSAYSLPVEEMFHDYLGEKDVDQEKAGKKVIESIVKEIKKFFEQSAQAEMEERERNSEFNKDNIGNILIKSGGTDYSSQIYNKS